LFKRYLFLIKPEDLFDLSGFGSAKAKHAVNIMHVMYTSNIGEKFELEFRESLTNSTYKK
jgi:hypothetical protein